MESFPQKELIRLTLKDGSILIDESGLEPGRGMYICRNADCIENMIKKKAFNRACRRSLNNEMLDALKVELLSVIKEETNVKKS